MHFGCKIKRINEIWFDIHRILNTVAKKQLQSSHFGTWTVVFGLCGKVLVARGATQMASVRSC